MTTAIVPGMPTQEPDRWKEYFQSARTELAWRVAHRDQWLKAQLVAQVAVFAFANGLDLGIVKSSAPIPYSAAFAFPVSLTVAVFYFVEDRLIGLLSRYLGALTRAMPPVVDGRHLLSWDISPQLARYAQEGTLLARVVGQVLAFLVLPSAVFALSSPPAHEGSRGFLLIQVGSGLGVVFLIIWSYWLRKDTGLADRESVLVGEAPVPAQAQESQPRRVLLILTLLLAVAALALGLWIVRSDA